MSKTVSTRPNPSRPVSSARPPAGRKAKAHHTRSIVDQVGERELLEFVCGQMRLAWEVSGLSKAEFAISIGISPARLSNILRHRNQPSLLAIVRACRVYGLTADFFLRGELGGIRDRSLVPVLTQTQARLDLPG